LHDIERYRKFDRFWRGEFQAQTVDFSGVCKTVDTLSMWLISLGRFF